MPNGNSLTITSMKRFLLIAIRSEPDPRVSKYTVAIHQQEFDSPGALNDISFGFRVSSFEVHRANANTGDTLPILSLGPARYCSRFCNTAIDQMRHVTGAESVVYI